jgi:hypothetical protein
MTKILIKYIENCIECPYLEKGGLKCMHDDFPQKNINKNSRKYQNVINGKGIFKECPLENIKSK